jgi:hypothetical protein
MSEFRRILKDQSQISYNVAVLFTSILVIFTIVGGLPARAANPLGSETKLYVDPQFSSQPIGSNFTINIRLSNVTDLFGFDLNLSWDPTVLEYLNHVAKIPVEDYPDGVLHEPLFWLKNEVNAVTGSIWLVASSLSPAPTFNGSGIIFNITFQVLAEGVSELNFLADDLAKPGVPIEHQTINGTFDNRPASGFLVVRGADDGVWYRMFDGVSWGDWFGLGGVTYNTPAVAVLAGQLHFVVTGMDGALWWGSVDLEDESFSGWQWMSGRGVPNLTSSP